MKLNVFITGEALSEGLKDEELPMHLQKIPGVNDARCFDPSTRDIVLDVDPEKVDSVRETIRDLTRNLVEVRRAA